MHADNAWLVLTLAMVAGAVGSFINWLTNNPTRSGTTRRKFHLYLGIVLLGLAAMVSTITVLR